MSPLQAGVAELPATLASMLVVLLVGLAVRHLGTGGSIGFGLILTSVGLIVLAYAEGLTTFTGIIIALLIIGLGVGLASTVATDAVVGSVPRERAGAASAISETAYELGVALGIAILGSLMTAQYRSRLPDLSALPEDIAASVNDSLAAGLEMLGSAYPDVVASVQHAFTGGMQVTALVAASILLVAGFFAWRVIPRRLEVPSSDVDAFSGPMVREAPTI